MLIATLLAAQTKSSGTNLLLPILLVVFAGVYFLVLRPRQKAQQKARQQTSLVEVGDEVVTIGGVRGVVVAVDDEHVTIATGQLPGDEGSAGSMTHITFVRKAIGQKITPPVVPDTAPEAGGPGSDGEATPTDEEGDGAP